eukprot:COSAG01_NODE_24518_length_776_cov_1.022157_1_plen_28_part_10
MLIESASMKESRTRTIVVDCQNLATALA